MNPPDNKSVVPEHQYCQPAGAATVGRVSGIEDVNRFLQVATPDSWVHWAVSNPSVLLWDHGNCEKKAASSALSFLYRYPDHPALVYRMSRLAREELRHFEQVHKIIQSRGLPFEKAPAAKYASRLRLGVRAKEPQRLIDHLIVGAYIEARSCERFALIAPHLDPQLGTFYLGLVESEARHFNEYLMLAATLCDEAELRARTEHIGKLEAAAILEPDQEFSFHSGPPQA